MEQKEKKNLAYYMRILHRDIGFFVIGLIVIYSLSGIVLIYRDKDFMYADKKVERMLKPDMSMEELSNVMHVRGIEVTRTEGDVIHFENGSYNKSTGLLKFVTSEMIFPVNKMAELHKSTSRSITHWFLTTFGALLIFLAISSYWMFKKGTVLFKRGLWLSGAGILFSLILFFI